MRFDRRAERGRVGDRVPHAPVGHVDGDRAHAVDLEGGIEAVGKALDVGPLDAFAATVPQAARTSTMPPGASSRRNRLRFGHGQTTPVSSSTVAVQIVFEPDIGGVLGRLHDDEPCIAVCPRRRNHQVRVICDAAARLTQEKSPKRVAVRPQVLHLLEDGIAGRLEHSADDDVADLTACVIQPTTVIGEGSASAHGLLAAQSRRYNAARHRWASSRGRLSGRVASRGPRSASWNNRENNASADDNHALALAA